MPARGGPPPSGGHPKWAAIVEALAVFFFAPDRPPLRFADTEKIAKELDEPSANGTGGTRFHGDDVRVTLELLGDLTDCVFRRYDPATGTALDAVPAEVVGALLGASGQEGPEGERARAALGGIIVDGWPVAPVAGERATMAEKRA